MMKITAAGLAAFGLFCASARAATTSTANVGAHGGLAVLGDSGGNHFDVGVNGSYQIIPPLTADLNFSWIDRGGLNINGSQATGSLYLLYAGLMYDMSAFYPGFSLGAAMGVGFDHVSVTTGNNSNTNTTNGFYIGPKAGYDFPMGSSWTLGAQADWLITSKSNEPNVLEVLAVVKLWL